MGPIRPRAEARLRVPPLLYRRRTDRSIPPAATGAEKGFSTESNADPDAGFPAHLFTAMERFRTVLTGAGLS
jgi:hypothetical protein